MDIAQLVLVLLSCIMFVAVVTTLARAWREQPRRNARLVHDPQGEGWLTVAEVAKLLDTEPDEIVGLVERGSIPYFVDPDAGRAGAAGYRFRRDEIDDWVVG